MKRCNQFAVIAGVALVVLLFAAVNSFGAVVNWVGTYGNWPTTAQWTAIAGGTDGDDGSWQSDTLDLVGNATNPGLYCADNGAYIFFRMRVHAGTYPTGTPPNGSYLLLIDVVGAGNVGIDYAFAWDAKSNNNTNHGLEMSVAAVNGGTWGVSQLDDLDGSNGQKLTKDITGKDGTERPGDGYVRTDDGYSTTILDGFGTTTFIDFAVNWNYLKTSAYFSPGPGLNSIQSWNVALVTINAANDHATFNADFGNSIASGDLITSGWSALTFPALIPVPEPTTVLLLVLGGAWVGLIRPKRR